ncbi:response regulator transcription factor [Campylobacter vulpis]|uniref:Phosphate regulon transcriptional regulatory protein PhoB n=1 Tax=Campylobacter vulpis TaxID=1655500 RepID=A0A2G4QYN3_9BACT|nr:response regulator transcription factor [Campylobacter vulpis]MBS4235733.1 response regulator transcription factor [Campylobacter vulpis]MBS4241739.1 response regulator transcription factor [Campylobacter vulpis]MBS4252645.1 response regulator transcription factor [Campylobacter vulpis]MBS4269309.1 response regulator transcription factor [Campylobacter vulpis]MBS4274822.1 response regulator transcription factor [Campylobacter vulpis]
MVFVLEDDANILELVLYALKSQNINAQGFLDIESFRKALRVETPQILVLDVMLPNASGFEILKELKTNANTQNISVLMLTALNNEFDKVKGLDFGADDYITKPFSVMEFIARIRAILRRTPQDSENIILEELELSYKTREVKVCGTPTILTLKEFELLGFLLKNQNRVFSRDDLLEILWGYSYSGESRTIDIHIKTLRQKLGKASRFIKTIRGVGYKISKDS